MIPPLFRLHRAIHFAIKTHEIYQKQKRKGKNVSYVTHPLTAGILLGRVGANEDVIIAGILHDTIEDCCQAKPVDCAMLSNRFGENVAKLVMSVTEKNHANASWQKRKSEALRHISSFSHDELLVKSADVISNMGETLDDYARHGNKIFDRFHATRQEFLAHYIKVITKILKCWARNPFAKDLKFLLSELQKIQKTPSDQLPKKRLQLRKIFGFLSLPR
jgi:(p)ppGpp synthase/HD superfamily hydrolase